MDENKVLEDRIEIDDSDYDVKDVDPETHDIRRVIEREAGDTENGEPPFKAVTEEVVPNWYKVRITPDMWQTDATTYKCEVPVPGIRESCICHVFPDDDMISNKASDRAYAQQMIKDIYDEVLKVETDMSKIKCRWIGPKPKENIYLELEELPFFDCPGSTFGL